jgi:hypothetical protein
MDASRRSKWILTAFIGWTVAGLVSGCSAGLPSGSDEPLIEYHRQGGFAGLDDRLIIQGPESATLVQGSSERHLELEPGVVDELVAQLESIGFSSLQPEYLPQGAGADLIEYEVTYQGHTVRTMDTAVPDSLQPILNQLDAIIHSSQSP